MIKEQFEERICEMCGAPAKMVLLGWVQIALCETCHDHEAVRITQEWDEFHSGPMSELLEAPSD